MRVTNDIITIGFDKNNEVDFGIRCSIYELNFEQMKELRAMIPVAIGVMEQMWRDKQMRKPENMGKDATI